MQDEFSMEDFQKEYPNEDACITQFIRYRYPQGIFCQFCKRLTKHYKISKRQAYACASCRNHLYPLADTIFAKSPTPLRKWFLAMYLLTQSEGKFSARYLAHSLTVTYKTAWRMKKNIRELLVGIGTIPSIGLEETFMDTLLREQKRIRILRAEKLS